MKTNKPVVSSSASLGLNDGNPLNGCLRNYSENTIKCYVNTN